MNFLMLRGQVPKDRDPQEIVFDSIDLVDDVWTQLLYAMVTPLDYGEVWYWGGTRTKGFKGNFTERWIPSFGSYDSGDFVPNIIFCRGGFKQYHTVLKRFPNAIKIYYGAGRRYLPDNDFVDYDIILQDSPGQLNKCRVIYKKPETTLFIKPAADNIFYPRKAEKEYDVCFPANAAQAFKGHRFVYSTVPEDITVLNLGNKPDRYKHPHNVTSYRLLRHQMASHICKCRVGIVTVDSDVDSCPRVIPELLACGLPIIVLNKVKFWREKYIVSSVTGEIAHVSTFWDVVKMVLRNVDNYTPRKYYEENLSIMHAAKFLKERINAIR
jgi:hypothetical protein